MLRNNEIYNSTFSIQYVKKSILFLPPGWAEIMDHDCTVHEEVLAFPLKITKHNNCQG